MNTLSELKTKFRYKWPDKAGDRLSMITEMAEIEGWEIIALQENIGMVSFIKGKSTVVTRINIYLSTMSISTALKHPKKGRTQLYRKFILPDMLQKIFENPRKHTGRGYYEK